MNYYEKYTSGEGGWDEYYAEIAFFERFPQGRRKDVTFRTRIYEGLRSAGGDTTQTTNKDWRDGPRGHPYVHKWDARPVSISQNSTSLYSQ